MLKDNLNCTTKRVGRHKLSVFVVARFDKKTETYKPKTFNKPNYVSRRMCEAVTIESTNTKDK